jgi:LmbE family N-acetylglucosaminyl deacetylase
MQWIYLSPHLDDVALSVGGLLWEQTQAGAQVSVWTICSGDPPPGEFSPFADSLQKRWETGADSMSIRRAEDIESCRLLGADPVHFSVPDCIYRRSPKNGKHLYDSEHSLWTQVHPDEQPLVAQIRKEMATKLPDNAQIVCPFSIGNHVDHRLTRKAAEDLGAKLLYYPDYPYVMAGHNKSILEKEPAVQTAITSNGLQAWQNAVAAHLSQISTFWQNLDEMRLAIQEYSQQMGGVKLFT